MLDLGGSIPATSIGGLFGTNGVFFWYILGFLWHILGVFWYFTGGFSSTKIVFFVQSGRYFGRHHHYIKMAQTLLCTRTGGQCTSHVQALP